jgi:hypothetical protein
LRRTTRRLRLANDRLRRQVAAHEAKPRVAISVRVASARRFAPRGGTAESHNRDSPVIRCFVNSARSRCDHQTLSSNAPGDFVGGREGGEGRPAPARPTGGIVPSVERKECGLVPRRLPISPTIQFRPPAKWVTSPARSASVRLSAALGLPAS